MNRTWSVIIPFSAESINSVLEYGVDRTGVMALKQRWQKLGYTYLCQRIDERNLPEKFRFPIRISFACYFEKDIPRDHDNVFLMVKGIIDAFPALGLVPDDSSDFVKFGGVDFRRDRERPRVVVEIEELAPFPIADDGAIVQPYAEARRHQS